MLDLELTVRVVYQPAYGRWGWVVGYAGNTQKANGHANTEDAARRKAANAARQILLNHRS